MLKNVLIALAAVLIFNAIFVFSGGLELLVRTEQKEASPTRVGTDVVDVFRFTLEEEVRKKIGVPIEGYEPQMFLQVFPGLVATDFNGVEASIGQYVVKEGRLEHKMDESQLIHSAAMAVRHEGYRTLLRNITERTGIDLAADGTITDVIAVLIAE